MNVKYEQKLIGIFLTKNGWEEDSEHNSEYKSYYHSNDNIVSVDVSECEIVILDGSGDITHLPLNSYALLGYLLHNGYLPVGYDWR